MPAKGDKIIQEKLKELIKFAQEHGECTIEGAIRDILTDMMHICEEQAIDLDDRLESAREVYDEEINMEED